MSVWGNEFSGRPFVQSMDGFAAYAADGAANNAMTARNTVASKKKASLPLAWHLAASATITPVPSMSSTSVPRHEPATEHPSSGRSAPT